MTVHVLAIVGPTATGKTRLAVEVAHRLGSEIVSADSRQVYVGLDLGTGKDLDEYAAVDPPVPYHLIDVAPVERVYTLFDFQQGCFRLLERVAAEGKVGTASRPLLLVGGTGLYVEAVLRRYLIPDVPEDHELRRRLMALPQAELLDRLQTLSPEIAERTDVSSTKRLVRALEVALHSPDSEPDSGQALAVDLSYMVFAVTVPRPVLRRRIARRLRSRLEAGMEEEVRGLMSRGIDLDRLRMLGMEYRHIAEHLAGHTSRLRMIDDLELAIRHLAKRQETYFRGLPRRGVPVTWIGPNDGDAVLEAVAEGRWTVSRPA